MTISFIAVNVQTHAQSPKHHGAQPLEVSLLLHVRAVYLLPRRGVIQCWTTPQDVCQSMNTINTLHHFVSRLTQKPLFGSEKAFRACRHLHYSSSADPCTTGPTSAEHAVRHFPGFSANRSEIGVQFFCIFCSFEFSRDRLT